MKLEIKVSDHLCELEVFRINGIDADYNDFGIKKDSLPLSSSTCMCENMRFFSVPVNQTVLDKYEIQADDYFVICSELQDKLSFGRCGWCI